MPSIAHIKEFGWKPGRSGNPNGRPKLPGHIRLIKDFSPAEISKYIAKYGRSTIEELVMLESSNDAPIIERIIARMFRQAFDGKPECALPTLKFLLDRSIGKVPDVVMTESPEDIEREELRKLSLNELLQVVRKLIPDDKSFSMPKNLSIE